MSRPKNEVELLNKFGIEDFRHLTKDMVISLQSSLAKMDKDVAMKIIDQFPEYRGAVCDLVDDYKEITKNSLALASESNKNFYEASNRQLDILYAELNKDDLSHEERFEILDRISDTVNSIDRKDTENKNFILKLVGGIGVVFVGAAALMANVLGSSTNVSKKEID